jgi:hypothetical protein
MKASTFVFLLSLLIAPSAQAGPEMLSNTGFEMGGAFPYYWWHGNSSGVGSLVVDGAKSHSGSKSMLIDVTGGSFWVYTGGGGVPVQSGQKYKASVWLSSSSLQRVRITLQHAMTGFVYAAMTVDQVPQAWTQYAFSGFTDAVNAILLVKAETPGKLWVDDASLTSVEGIGATVASAGMPAAQIPMQYFGMHTHQHIVSSWPSVPIGSRRIWDAPAGASWDTIASCSNTNTDGTCASGVVYNWTKMDAIVAEAEQHGVDLVMNLGRTPTWASARPSEPSPYGLGKSAEPKNNQMWTEWVSQIGNRYRGRIKYWEVWNEPNFPWKAASNSFYTGTPEKLLALQQIAYQTLKDIDQDNKILTPAFTDFDYAEYFMRIGGGYTADILSYHFYTNEGNPLSHIDRAPEKIYKYYAGTIRHLADNYTGGKKLPVWNTEQGWITNSSCAQMDQEYAQNLLARAYIMNWASGVQRFYFYGWDNHCMAVQPTLADNVTRTPTGDAYAQIVQWLNGKRMTNLTIDSHGTYVVTIADAADALSYIVWNPTVEHELYSKQFIVPQNWNVSQHQRIGGPAWDAYPGWELNANYNPFLVY